MITISRELENAFGLSPLYSKEGQGFNATVLAMFVLPGTSACWMATEAERQPNGDWVFFGYCHIHEWEWGYFSFSELAELDLHGYVVENPSHPTGQTEGHRLLQCVSEGGRLILPLPSTQYSPKTMR